MPVFVLYCLIYNVELVSVKFSDFSVSVKLSFCVFSQDFYSYFSIQSPIRPALFKIRPYYTVV